MFFSITVTHLSYRTFFIYFWQLTTDLQSKSFDSHDISVEDITSTDNSDDSIILFKSKRHILNNAHTLRGFNLPKLEVNNVESNSFEMMNLPSKNVLKKKRKDMKISVKNVSLVMNRKTNNDDNNYYNINRDIDVNKDAEDIWKQFDNIDDEKNLLHHDIDIKDVNTRAGFHKNETVIYIKLLANNILSILYMPLKYCYKIMFTCDKNIISGTLGKLRKNNEKNNNNTKVEKNEKYIENENEKSEFDNIEEIDGLNKNPEADTVSYEGEEEEEIQPLTPENLKNNDPLDFSLMSFNKAMFYGYLNKEEYSALLSWYCSMILVAIFGITLGETVSPRWLGYVIWFSIWLTITSLIPIIQYFNTYKLSIQMIQLIIFSVSFHIVFCGLFFVFELNIDINNKKSLWILNYLVLFPLFLNIIINLLIWRDNGYKNIYVEDIIRKKSIKNKCKNFINYIFQSYPYFLLIIVVFNVEFYFYIGILAGEILTVLILVSVIGFLFLKNWTESDYYMNKNLIKFGTLILKISATVSFVGMYFLYLFILLC